MSITEEVLAKIPGSPLEGLRRVDALWKALREETIPVPNVVDTCGSDLDSVDWDIVICGGTLGILIGAALVRKGWRVTLIERGILKGREQEWNISRQELNTFIELGLLSEEELENAIATQFNPVRVSFSEGADIFVKDVLNTGVNPVYLLEKLKQFFLENGGNLIENTPFENVVIHPNGVCVNRSITARLMLDAMGYFSPVVQQARQGKKPDGVCLVVGTCAKGFTQNESGDLIASFTPIQKQCQYFWEAFPARDGRTTYLFTYLDADRDRFSLETLFDDYFKLLPEYQNIELDQLEFVRALFGFFPCYRQSPLKLEWDRILAIGDSSGSQSPLSFGGFGAMVRHLKRLTNGIDEALQSEMLNYSALSLLQPYQPNLSVTWLFQRSMSVGMNQKATPDQINQLLVAVFAEMQQLGEPVLKPFLQDVVQFIPLSQTLLKTGISHPGLVLKIIPHVGIFALLDWMLHYFNLAVFSALYAIAQHFKPPLSPTQQYVWNRWVDAWQYGSGNDYVGY
ncbi:FAD-dependent oxidoreductase [Leptolyngbya sp. NIES-2104]|uniref:FAD-dependent oxidoreductase n=1 Tax=Leptolyngbya sp. NIES-2104 TaxID=1552121 RepID=UPI0006EC664E|nr:FAD-dependent oxidoreductase [Leptolyngbya sp. NIES-2104]GAP98485.1 lycopene cyclase, CruP type [Leptolyngbya sp. NIES-2104]